MIDGLIVMFDDDDEQHDGDINDSD